LKKNTTGESLILERRSWSNKSVLIKDGYPKRITIKNEKRMETRKSDEIK